jgi:heptosyltransferase III
MTPPRSVLVVITRRIGDVLLATPLIRSLKQAWPQASVDALVFAGTSAILAHNPDLAHVITVAERPRAHEHLALLKRIWRKYDLTLSLLPGDRPTVYAWAAGRASVGLLTPERNQWWKRLLLSRAVAFEPLDTHTVAMHLALADALGIARSHEVVIGWNREDEDRARQALPFNPDHVPFAVLHCWPKFNYKMWHESGWAQLAEHLVARGLRPVLSGSNEPKEVAYVNSIARAVAGTVDVAGKISLPALAFLVSRARVYVGPDTAVTHIAAAVETPTVALYGPSNPVKWGPWPKHYSGTPSPWRRHGSQVCGKVRLLQGTGRCVPCLSEGCERNIASFSDCLQTLPPQRVISAVDDLLRGQGR